MFRLISLFCRCVVCFYHLCFFLNFIKLVLVPCLFMSFAGALMKSLSPAYASNVLPSLDEMTVEVSVEHCMMM